MSPKIIVVINAASDGIFYHGMGMGSGINAKRLLKNIPRLMFRSKNLLALFKSMKSAIKTPLLAARLLYFSLNHLSYSDGKAAEVFHPGVDNVKMKTKIHPKLLVFSPYFPARGFFNKYPIGCLFRNWSKLQASLLNKFTTPPNVLLFPCAPIQLLDIK